MTVPQVQIFVNDKTIITTRMQAIPRVGENILHQDCYFKVKDVFHKDNGVMYVICDNCWYFMTDYNKGEIRNSNVERFKKAIILNAAIERGDLKIATKEVNQDE